MASSGLRGPFPLTIAGVDSAVTNTSAGAYALGQANNDGAFVVRYVGRSDDDVNARLKKHVPELYRQFKYEYYPSARAAFDKECNLYHDFHPRDSKIHPARPEDANWKCPRCDALG
jgi:hypothetical protein